MKQTNFTWLIYVAAVLVVVGLIGFAIVQKATPGQYDTFAQCLTDKGAKMYGAWWCPHCQKQKDLFGKSFEKVSNVECSAPGTKAMLKICKDAGIEGYPTWKFQDGSMLSGEQSFETLSQKTSCPIN